ncbi:MAG TPA: tRNA threonylcarbamoyladenosine dehydratase [Verrucomicrobiae bacterium]|jgi:tRNA A37 threonylcarbamoyladenosine dehydratase|nr:tRNA threonylcarbamoyladenosine dehydratase [Verrucomicrobiae bacterium]
MNDDDLRFGGLARLYGADGLQRLLQSRVCVVGIGGVGSWAAEALARSAVGHITLVDLDDVCLSNVNRQLHALDGTIGRPKVEVMAERIRAIHPACEVRAVPEFFNEATAKEILATGFEFVLDAIDQVTNKCLLIARCRQKEIPIVCAGGAGGRRDPAAIQVADLAQTSHDALLQKVRKKLRDAHGFARDPKTPFGVQCVFSAEPATAPASGCTGRVTCDNGYGTAGFVTGTMGLVAASRIVSKIAAG